LRKATSMESFSTISLEGGLVVRESSAEKNVQGKAGIVKGGGGDGREKGGCFTLLEER